MEQLQPKTARRVLRGMGVYMVALLCLAQPCAVAQEVMVPNARLVISEVQTGTSASAFDEYIELAVLGETGVSISNWRLFASSSSLTAPSFGCELATLSSVIEPGDSLLVTSAEYIPPSGVDVTATYAHAPCTSNSILSPTKGVISLLDDTGTVRDQFSYGPVVGTQDTQSLAVTSSSRTFERKAQPDTGILIDTDNSFADFQIVSSGTPGRVPQLIVPDPLTPVPSSASDPVTTSDPVPDPEPVDTPSEQPQSGTESTTPDPLPTTPDVPVAASADTQTPQAPSIVYLPISINELMIDPVSPQTDANDEWIELYNPNDQVVELAGYSIASGATFSYTYTFPAGSRIEPHGYVLVTSGDTPIALANSGGAARAADPNGIVVDTIMYDDAKSGQSWARKNDTTWSWTTTPTPLAENRITGLVAVVQAMATTAKKPTTSTTKKTSAATSSTKTATTKATAKPKSTTVKAATTSLDTPAQTTAPMPLPTWLLALTASLAVLYGLYEYRFDMANKLWQFRKYREARARARQ